MESDMEPKLKELAGKARFIAGLLQSLVLDVRRSKDLDEAGTIADSMEGQIGNLSRAVEKAAPANPEDFDA